MSKGIGIKEERRAVCMETTSAGSRVKGQGEGEGSQNLTHHAGPALLLIPRQVTLRLF